MARFIRHEAANHYPYKAAKKNLEYLGENANLSFLLHDMEGNSVYPLGEEVMFGARFNRFSQATTSKGRNAVAEEWMTFNLEATKWLRDSAAAVLETFVLNRFPDKFAERKMFHLEAGSASKYQATCVPLFMKDPRSPR